MPWNRPDALRTSRKSTRERCNVGTAGRVWYVSYGSNLNRARFLAYLQGGLVAGNDVVHRGCADTTPPLDDVALELPHALYFAGWSARVWGGTSAAFTTLAPQSASTLARAYLVTRQQFIGVVQQENGNRAEVEDFDVKLEAARQHGHARMLATGGYSELIRCGERDGHPMLSFTASENRRDFRRPSAAYLHVIGTGLKECHGLRSSEVAAYLGERPGVRGTWTHDQLLNILTTASP
jgi:hypothetical protein